MGELSTFVATDRRPPTDLPVSLHKNLEQTFRPLEVTLRKYLFMVYEQTVVAMSLGAKKYCVYVAGINDLSL